ncbi:DUF4345 domain-containing protein [Seonamhaeicola sp.]|uniref:DUF4345 domain-containing protein n=1 Tax=Seonamhaeicola sp. TaxID=1912245 RepID=UPI002625859B|nr:DUF4345 domain-containing protein [Seonamhaeicola sp.]
MNNNKIVTAFLILAGLTGLFVGGGLLFFPAQLQADNGIILSCASHFSEARAPGAAILSASVFIFFSVFRTNWRKSAIGLAALFFLSYGTGRLLSLILDGKPADGLFYAMIGELIIGIIALIFLKKVKNS